MVIGCTTKEILKEENRMDMASSILGTKIVLLEIFMMAELMDMELSINQTDL